MLVQLVANPAASAGKAARGIDGVADHLRAAGAQVETHVPTGAKAARSLMTDLAAQGAERIVVHGGDGIVHAAVNALAGTDTVLAIMAAGTGNDTAAALGLPSDPAKAAVVALGPARAIDLIESEAGLAVTVAIVGFAVSVNERADRLAWPKGAAKYTVATLAELPRLATHSLSVTVDGQAQRLDTNLLAIANLSCFGGGMKIAPDADPTDGQLDIVSIGPAAVPTFATLLPTVFSGRHVRNRRVTMQRGREVHIEASSATPLRVRADGEPWGELPLTLRARPSTLRVARLL